ncbi:MAG: glycosyltransferase, partial [Dehalococcoidia bacterium]
MTEQILVAAIGGFLVVQAVALVISAYHSLVIVVGSLLSPRRSGSGETQPTVRFGLMIPARNEERVIRDLIADLRAQAYPQDLVTILVVAHDCSDRTAAVARECGAAAVELRAPGGGKAAAMKKGIEWFGNSVDLVGVFDADVRVDPGVLRAVSSLPAGDAAVQPETAFSSGLEGVALEHAVARRGRALLRWRPRSRIGLSVVFNAGGYFVRP